MAKQVMAHGAHTGLHLCGHPRCCSPRCTACSNAGPLRCHRLKPRGGGGGAVHAGTWGVVRSVLARMQVVRGGRVRASEIRCRPSAPRQASRYAWTSGGQLVAGA